MELIDEARSCSFWDVAMTGASHLTRFLQWKYQTMKYLSGEKALKITREIPKSIPLPYIKCCDSCDIDFEFQRLSIFFEVLISMLFRRSQTESCNMIEKIIDTVEAIFPDTGPMIFCIG